MLNSGIKVLIADDELEFRNAVKRFLNLQGFEPIMAANGDEAFIKAKDQQPNVILLDINMPKMDGFSVCQKLRENPSTRLTPILMLTARIMTEDKITGFNIGADDYLPKPFNLAELKARIETLLKRNQKMICANPLTQLPGSPIIQEEIERRINSRQKFGVAYIDIDNFKAYNDLYDYHHGDEVIKWTSKMMQDIIAKFDNSNVSKHFLGHIGGDDFIMVSDSENIKDLCEIVAREFDRSVKTWYTSEHAMQGYIQTKDRQGNLHEFPLMALSIGVSTNDKREITHYGQVAQITSELKNFAKNRAEKGKSVVVFDRRTC